jgi:excisionase family DNA binding protein
VTRRYRINWDVFDKLFPPTQDPVPASATRQNPPKKRRQPRQPVGDLMTVRQVAERLAVDAATVTSWIRSGQLKASNVGKGLIRPRWRIDLGDLKTFLIRCQAQADPPPARRGRRADPGVIQFYT